MGRGDIHEVTAGDASELYYVDVGLFDTPEYGSVYVLAGEQPALVDTGTGHSYEVVLGALADLGIDRSDLAAILLTHVHLDHAGGASPLASACPNADVYVHGSGAQFLRDPERIWTATKAVVGDRIEYYREPDPVPDDRLVELDDGDTVELGSRSLDVHRAPGHAFHQIVYHDRASNGVFTADAAGVYVPTLDRPRPTSPPPGFDLEDCLDDIAMLRALDPDALYYGHFGDQPTGDRLRAYRETLESWVEAVATKRAELGDDAAVAAHFAGQTDTAGVWSPEHARGEERMNVTGVLRYLDERAD
ncbi:MAG: Zn-dependent hydrolase [halophilic archaeon J07HX64]|jgi:Zn-dependent hydrolases, including glyoxylases|nr:MAG: Zn-dependent hydrolase [halophilic archaeon J07HX64]